jgi:hypothetical protein
VGKPARPGARRDASRFLAVLLVLVGACHSSVRPPAHASPAPRAVMVATHTVYRSAKMDRIAHFMSKYWDGGAGDPLDVYNLELTHSTATGCKFGAFHAFHEKGDLASHDTRHDARVQLQSNGAEVVGFGQYHGDWWAVAEDCA